ncbi:transcription termination factor NusA [Chitinivibrio alkaliphilus]|uniref:Transcription termination/antitermination protein NusA n=1 Tax=Chitinivibrio alkaliphilus ACht1 TaxID=1313304 RepID=U7D881_9BACT|nr:transcription termination factor NusA [Chitinivibrio alkaliphilus]ERP32148.1 NusA antitermination factor [Chitinivibrio alkaliphilus ACht1]
MARKRKFKMNGTEIIEGLKAITKERSISWDLAENSLKEAIAQAARKGIKKAPAIGVTIDKETGDISAYTYQKVVDDDEIEDIYQEIPLSEAQEDYGEDLKIGDEVVWEENLDISEFGRTAIQIAKQIIIQRIREHERTKIYNDFSERIGDMVTGKIRQIERGNIIIDLGRTEALLPKSHQIRGEKFHQGGTVRGVIIEVKDNAKGAQVIISRTSPVFLERLFEIEVPEIFEGVISITKIVREPGYRAKIAVETRDERIDPVGACVGMRGNRIRAIVREVNNERMDIMTWTDEISILARRALASVDINRVIPVGSHKIIIIVDDEDLAKAIGKEWKNLKLTSEFTGYDIDIYGEDQFDELSEEERAKILSFDETTETIDAVEDVLDDEEIGDDAPHEIGKETELATEESVSYDEEDRLEQ